MSELQFALDYGIPSAISVIMHPFYYGRIMIMLGYEPQPPVMTDTIMSTFHKGYRRLMYPSIFGYLRNLKQDIGLWGLFTIGLPASVVGANVKTLTTEYFLKIAVPSYYKKKSFIETELGMKHFLRETSKLAVARILGIVTSYPFQVIMVRQMAEAVGEEACHSSSIIKCLSQILAEESISGLFSGVMPRVIGETVAVWLTAFLAYGLNRFVFPESSDPEMKQHTPFLAGILVASFTHSFTVTSIVMSASNAGLKVSVPFNSSWQCYKYLRDRHALVRGASLFFRYAQGPV